MALEDISDSGLPLIISVTGHRDLLPAEADSIRERVNAFFLSLREQFPEYQLVLLNPLAEGADQLVAEVALKLDVTLIAPLPKALHEYRSDFKNEESRARFEAQLARASHVLELQSGYCDPADPDQSLESESLCYANLGVFLCSHCHILLALWDGKTTEEVGGTSQVVWFHHHDHMKGFVEKNTASQKQLFDDESDLVYHIVCSRDRPDGEPPPELVPLDWFWFTKDAEKPLAKALPEQHRRIFEHGAEFNRDIRKYLSDIQAQGSTLLENIEKDALPDGIEDIDRLFTMSDWLAIHYKTLTHRTLFLTHTSAFIMGVMFLLYSDFDSRPLFMWLFLFFFSVAGLTTFIAKRQGWQRKYLDYRTLAEGLRVQFYWAAAGITSDAKWRFAHDSYLQTQDPDFGWIRNVMRVAGTRYDSNPCPSGIGLDFVIDKWVGGGENGQLGYFKKMASDRIRKDRLTLLLDRTSLAISAIAVLIFLFFGSQLSEATSTGLFLLMGGALLLYGVREAFAHATAVKELIKQYEFMLRIFDSAYRRLTHASTHEEKKQILLSLGQSALEEHSDWILMHYERSLDQGEIWRMGN